MMMMMGGETWAGLGSIVAGIMFMSAMFQQYFPRHLRDLLQIYFFQLMNMVNPYMQISFHEQSGGRFSRNEAYTSIEAYLSTHSSTQAKRLKADITTNSAKLVLNLDNHEEVTDQFQGVKFWWKSHVSTTNRQNPFYGDNHSEEKRSFRLSFHKRHRDLVINSYLRHVLEEGKDVVVRNRQRRLYTNNSGHSWRGSGSWTHVAFQHRATFQNLAMGPLKKKQIEDDLLTFCNSKDYYAKIGKAWKRGYLLYGPPGTGKTTMIAAMANLLNYDIYDLELTAVKNNTELRKLLIETSGKSVIVIEDIDCSLDLTGKRKKEKEKEKKDENDPNRNLPKPKEEGNDKNNTSDITLSGLLNFIDGLWSSCGEERIIVFTTNHVEKLDPALIRSGRMDMHIELSYCCFEGFKVLAENYLDIKSHSLFDRIRGLLEETQMSPADVAENLMPKTIKGEAKTSLENLIRALEMAKEKGKSSTKDTEEEEEKVITEKEEKEKSVSGNKKQMKLMNKDKSLFYWYRRASSKKRGKVANQSVPENS
ncbi:AAA-ATPase At3g28580-like [Telopea speciosissima]|uniref:AAA-ATPase At3g28580-like n=1 Tax=Telopea speciosissima TaxID=54955 RepID=UPI001CC76ED7|nr:AAA-ATPase At3g28580-like [Telopea speciosissima]